MTINEIVKLRNSSIDYFDSIMVAKKAVLTYRHFPKSKEDNVQSITVEYTFKDSLNTLNSPLTLIFIDSNLSLKSKTLIYRIFDFKNAEAFYKSLEINKYETDRVEIKDDIKTKYFFSKTNRDIIISMSYNKKLKPALKKGAIFIFYDLHAYQSLFSPI